MFWRSKRILACLYYQRRGFSVEEIEMMTGLWPVTVNAQLTIWKRDGLVRSYLGTNGDTWHSLTPVGQIGAQQILKIGD